MSTSPASCLFFSLQVLAWNSIFFLLFCIRLCEGGELLDRILAKYVLRTPPMQICVETIFWTFMLIFDGAGVILCEWPLQGHDHLPCMFLLARADTIFVC
jgi:hypothetical protein